MTLEGSGRSTGSQGSGDAEPTSLPPVVPQSDRPSSHPGRTSTRSIGDFWRSYAVVPTGSVSNNISRFRNKGTSPSRIPFDAWSESHHSQLSIRSKDGRLSLHAIVHSSWFEGIIAVLIALNAIVIALEVQYNGIQVGYDLGYPGSSNKAEDAWPGALNVFEILNWIFGVAFAVELVLKVITERGQYIFDAWNLFDALLVGSWLLRIIGTAFIPIEPTLLRLARLMRLFRLIRFFKHVEYLDSLVLMAESIVGSISALSWSILILIVVQTVIALALQELLEGFMQDPNNPFEHRMLVYEYFGSYSRGMLTQFELTMGNWIVPCRVLTEYVSEWFILFFVWHQFFIGFAVVRVIMGVFLQVTFKVATNNDTIMMNQKVRSTRVHTSKIRRLFMHLDDTGDGNIDREEFRKHLGEPEVKTWLSAMELDVKDIDVVFNLVDIDGNGEVTVEELVQGCASLRGNAKSLDLALLIRSHRQLQSLIRQGLGADVAVQRQISGKSGASGASSLFGKHPFARSQSGRVGGSSSGDPRRLLKGGSGLNLSEGTRVQPGGRFVTGLRRSTSTLGDDLPPHREEDQAPVAESSRDVELEGSSPAPSSSHCGGGLAAPGGAGSITTPGSSALPSSSALLSSALPSSVPPLEVESVASDVFGVSPQPSMPAPSTATSRTHGSVSFQTAPEVYDQPEPGPDAAAGAPPSAGHSLAGPLEVAPASDISAQLSGSLQAEDLRLKGRAHAMSRMFSGALHSACASRARSKSPLARRPDPFSLGGRSMLAASLEIVFAAAIVLNTLVMAMDAQYRSFDTAYGLSVSIDDLPSAGGVAPVLSFDESPSSLTFADLCPAAQVWPWAEDFFVIVDWIFGFAFALEIVLKLVMLGRDFFRDWWSAFDSLLVIVWFFEVSQIRFIPLNSAQLRLARLFRLLRVVKLVRTIQGFESLVLLMTAIRASLSALFWSSLFLLVLQMLIALLINQMLVEYINDETQPQDRRELVYMYYGTTSRAMLTMFEISLANWIPSSRVLTEFVSEWYVIYALGHKCIIGFAVIMVITGVFVQETIQAANTNDALMLTQKESAMKTHVKKMKALFSYVDDSGDGLVTREEWIEKIKDRGVKIWLSAMGLNLKEEQADAVFGLLDEDGDGELTALELVRGLAALRGEARNIDLIALLREQGECIKGLTEIVRERLSHTPNISNGGACYARGASCEWEHLMGAEGAHP